MRKFASLLLLSLFSIFLLTSCKQGMTHDGYLCVTFHLEGALYQQSEEVRYYYPPDEDGKSLIVEPNDLIQDAYKISKEGYYLEGWYLSDEFKPEEKWDFATDKLTTDGLDLYANWKLEAIYKFVLKSSVDDSILGEYTVDEGGYFDDYSHFAINNAPKGYTFVDYRDEDGNVIDDTFVHPGGDTDTSIDIYAYYIEGEYTVVKSFSNLRDAIDNKTNIYLYNDIDCKGSTLDFGDFTNRIFIGNGHTISNFSYEVNLNPNQLENDTTYISLFDDISNSTIKDVMFSDCDIEGRTTSNIQIYVVPFALKITDSTLENIALTYSLSIRASNGSVTEIEGYSMEDPINSTITDVNITKQ